MNLPTWFNCSLIPEVDVYLPNQYGHKDNNTIIYKCVTGKCAFELNYIKEARERDGNRFKEYVAREMKKCCVAHCQQNPDLSFYGIVQTED